MSRSSSLKHALLVTPVLNKKDQVKLQNDFSIYMAQESSNDISLHIVKDSSVLVGFVGDYKFVLGPKMCYSKHIVKFLEGGRICDKYRIVREEAYFLGLFGYG